jgi:hypothetical protein
LLLLLLLLLLLPQLLLIAPASTAVVSIAARAYKIAGASSVHDLRVRTTMTTRERNARLSFAARRPCWCNRAPATRPGAAVVKSTLHRPIN